MTRPPAAPPSRGGASRSRKRPAVTLVVDGSAVGNPGPGGWAALLRHGKRERLISGMAEGDTTNNRMELVALLEGLKALKKPCDVRVVTDSQYVRGMVDFGWKRRANADLLEGIDALRRDHTVTFELVRGHAGHADNERVDREARSQAEHATDRRGATGARRMR